MQQTHFSIILFSLIWLCSCNPKEDPTRILKFTSLYTPETVTVLHSKLEWGVGEAVEEYELSISGQEYFALKKSIESKPYFIQLKNKRTQHRAAYENDASREIVTEVAYEYEEEKKYYYQIFNPKLGTVVSVVLRSDSTIHLRYLEL